MAEVDRRKAELIAELEVSRGEMRSSMRRVEHSADLVQRVRKNVGQNLGYWMTGGLATGFLLARLLLPVLFPRSSRSPERDPLESPQEAGDTDWEPTSAESALPRSSSSSRAKQKPEAPSSASPSMLVAVAKIAFELAKPKLMELAGVWLSRQLNRQLGSLFQTSEADASRSTPPTASNPKAEL